uniref:Uncharacterized protein n=1 Tax=Leptospirillum ferriphilum TaxID=178606 RepID=A0A2I2MHJ8_9BACT
MSSGPGGGERTSPANRRAETGPDGGWRGGAVERERLTGKSFSILLQKRVFQSLFLPEEDRGEHVRGRFIPGRTVGFRQPSPVKPVMDQQSINKGNKRKKRDATSHPLYCGGK